MQPCSYMRSWSRRTTRLGKPWASLWQALASEDLERKFVGLGHFYLVLREKNFDLCRWTHALRVTEADLAERGLSVASLADAACRSPSVFGH